MRTFSYLIGCISILFFMGCSHTIPGGLVDATAPVSQRGYQILGESEGSVSSTFVFGIQTSKPDMEVAIRKAIDRLGGDELVNVTWDHKRSNYFLFGTYTFIVRGTVIKRTEEGMPITTAIKPRPLSEFGSEEPVFDGLNFALSYSRFSKRFETFFGESDTFKESGLRVKLGLRNSDALLFFYPELSYADYDGIKTIPLTANLGVNFSRIQNLSEHLPQEINPYANFGLGYYLTKFSDWEWTEFGYNFGLGVEYKFQPNVYFGFGFNYHKVFTDLDYSFWDWNLGLSYFLTK